MISWITASLKMSFISHSHYLNFARSNCDQMTFVNICNNKIILKLHKQFCTSFFKILNIFSIICPCMVCNITPIIKSRTIMNNLEHVA